MLITYSEVRNFILVDFVLLKFMGLLQILVESTQHRVRHAKMEGENLHRSKRSLGVGYQKSLMKI